MGHLCGTARRHPPRGVDRWCAHRALHLLRSRASADLERQVESELVIRLLEGTADAATLASRLGSRNSRCGSSPFALTGAPSGTLRCYWRSNGTRRDSDGPAPGPADAPGPGRVVACCRIPPSTRCCPAAAQRWGSDLRAALPAGVIVLAGDQRRRCCRRACGRAPGGRRAPGTARGSAD